MNRLILTLWLILAIVACGPSRKVSRIDTQTTTDLSGRWNDTDSRLVAQEMIADCLARPWIDNFLTTSMRKPVVTVGVVRNLTSEHISTETFISDIEREMINSARVRFVASRPERDEVREEKLDQQEYASAATMKRLREETGADFILNGAIKTIVDQFENKKIVYYQTDLQLINVETNEKVWIGTKKIKKEISQRGTKW